MFVPSSVVVFFINLASGLCFYSVHVLFECSSSLSWISGLIMFSAVPCGTFVFLLLLACWSTSLFLR